MVITFSILVVSGLLSLCVLMSLNNTLFSIQGNFSLLQSGYGQEEDEEETKKVKMMTIVMKKQIITDKMNR